MLHVTTDCASLPSLHCSSAAAWRLTAAATSAEAAAPAASTPREPLSWFWSAAATFWALMAGGGSWGRTRSKACWLTLHRVASGERWTQGLAFAGQRLVLPALAEFLQCGPAGHYNCSHRTCTPHLPAGVQGVVPGVPRHPPAGRGAAASRRVGGGRRQPDRRARQRQRVGRLPACLG